jgi:hypothetical protein
MCTSSLKLGLSAAGFIGIVNARLMPNQIQLWLRFLHYGEDNHQPMQVVEAYTGLVPDLLAPLHTYMYSKYGYKNKGQFLFLYKHMLNMLTTYCSVPTQKEILQWISEYNNSVTHPS